KKPSGKRPVEIPVKPGHLVSVFAEGSLRLRKDGPQAQEVGPEGRDASRDAKKLQYLLPTEHSPATVSGALVGSFDGFRKSSFVIGKGAPLKVPAKAETLSLAINDSEGNYDQHGGTGYRIQAVQTPTRGIYAITSSLVTRDPLAERVPLPPGINL